MTHLYKLLTEITTLPLDNRWRKLPTKIFAQSLIGESPVCFQAPHKSVRIIDRAICGDNRIERNLIRHQKPFFL